MLKIKSFKKEFKLLFALVMIVTILFPASLSLAAPKKLTLNKSSATMEVGKTLKLTAANSESNIEWISEDNSVATVKKGLVTARGEGTVYIVAISGKLSATCKIDVYQPTKKVKLKAEYDCIEVGDLFHVTAEVIPENATYNTFSWRVQNADNENPAIEQISDNEFKAAGVGTATIFAYQEDTEKEYKLKIAVKETLGTFHIESDGKKVTSLTTFAGGHILLCGVSDNPEKSGNNTEPGFKYSIQNPGIARADERGQIIAFTEGTTNVTVTNKNGRSVSCMLTVTKDKEKLASDTFYADKMFDTVGLGNYVGSVNWAGADNTYIYKLDDGKIGVFNHKKSESSQSLQLYVYDRNFSYLYQKNIELPYSEWGGMYQGEDGYYYAAVGQNNSEQDNIKTVFSILKLNSDFEEVGRCNITGAECYTEIPYPLGCARMAMDGTTLIVYTDRQRYNYKVGIGLQSNITFVIETTTMHQNYVGNILPYNHVSGSLNQFVKMDQGNLIYLDHGDANPRSVVLNTHYNFKSFGWGDDSGSKIQLNTQNLMYLAGEVGDNYTGTKVNGFEVGTKHYIVAGVSVHHDSMPTNMLKQCDVQNVYISLIKKNGSISELKWLTNYETGKGVSANNLRMVKISEDEFALIYQITVNKKPDKTGLIIIDSEGNILKKREYEDCYSCCVQPIYYDNSIVWVDSDIYQSGNMEKKDTNPKIEQSKFSRIYLY